MSVTRLNPAYDFTVLTSNATTTRGYFVIRDSSITGDSFVAVSQHYQSDVAMPYYSYTVQPKTGYANVYVRTGSGERAADGTAIYYKALVVTPK